MSEWITHRRPTESDGIIWVCTPNYGPVLTEWNDCGSFPWMPCPAPEPYQPSEPDTPLSASIERMVEWFVEHGASSVMDDLDRILEAARKWDEHGKKYQERTSSGDKQQAPVVSSGDTAETQSDSKPDPIWCEWKEVSE